MNPGKIELDEKYERNHWPSIVRPDMKPPKGWSLSLVTAVNRVRNHRLSPDGKWIAFIWDREDLSDIYLVPSKGGWASRVTTNRKLVAYWDDEIPQWSPDSRWLAFTVDGHVHISPVEGDIPEKITDFTKTASSPVWMPDSNHLIVSIERDERTQLVLTDRGGSWPHALVTGSHKSGDAWDARPSPDGRWIAFTHRPFDDLRRLDTHLVDVASGQIRELTGTPGLRNWSPRWSPDSQQLAFLSQGSGSNQIWTVKPDGSGIQQITHLDHDLGDIEWSPDGAQIACTINVAGAFHLGLVEVQTGDVREILAGNGCYFRPNWTPDGKSLTVEHENPHQPPDLYRVDLRTMKIHQITFSNLPALARKPLIEPEMVSYKSKDGLEIPAFLYRPLKPNGAAVVYPHGGPSSQYTFEWDILAQYFLAKGYAWLAPNYRGSTGYGVEFEHANYGNWGQGDVQDCLFGARYLADLPFVDPKRIAIFGSSYGGYMTACCLSRDPDGLFACGIAKYGDANITSSWAQCNRDLRYYTEIFMGHPSDNIQGYIDASPIYQVDNVKKPVLILHGLLDDVVPPQASEEWVEALREAGKTFEYKTYAGEPHGFLQRKTQLDAYSRIERFLDWYLLPR